MSQDFQLAFECPHTTVEEKVLLDTDRRTLLSSQSVVPSPLVLLQANKTQTIPIQGLYRPAVLTAFQQGPYKTDSCNREFVVDSLAGTFPFTLPQGLGLTAARLVSELQQQTNALIFRDSNGSLEIEDVVTGRPEDSFLLVSGAGSDALGFVQKQDIAQMVYPPYGFAKGSDGNIRVQFLRPIRLNTDFYLTYSVNPTRCLRCAATRVENDYRFDEQGFALIVENENLLNQVALKMLLTVLGSNPYHPWYGTTISRRIGSKAVQSVAAAISTEVQRTLSKLQEIQRAQSKFQTITPEERLYSIDQINTTPSEFDPSIYNLDVVVRNASNKPVNISVIFTVPSVVATINKNNKQLQTL